MWRTILILCCLVTIWPAYGQDVFVPRELKTPPTTKPEAAPQSEKNQGAKESAIARERASEPVVAQPAKKPSIVEPPASLRSDKTAPVRSDPVKFPVVRPLPTNPHTEKDEHGKSESTKRPAKEISTDKIQVKIESDDLSAAKERVTDTEGDSQPAKKSAIVEVVTKPQAKEQPVNGRLHKAQMKIEPDHLPIVKEAAPKQQAEKVRPPKVEAEKSQTAKIDSVKSNLRPTKTQSEKTETTNGAILPEPTVDVQLPNPAIETGSTKLADGFDFPVGKPEAEGYYKARGFRSGGHVGEDWDGVRGGDTDLKDPIYCIGNGIVVFARDVHRGWGNVVIVRHAFRENGQIKHIDSLYGHLHSIVVKRGQSIARGQQLGTMGTAHGQYDAHLHLEIRKNLEIGMSRAKFSKTFNNYYDPSQFIESHRHLSGGGGNLRVAMNTFTHDSAFHFDDSPNYPMRKHSTAQSAAALKQALSGTR